MLTISKSKIYSIIIPTLIALYLFSGYLNVLLPESWSRTLEMLVYFSCISFMVLIALESKLNFLKNFLILIVLFISFILFETLSSTFRDISIVNPTKLQNLLLIITLSTYVASYYAKNLDKLDQLAYTLSFFAWVISILMFISFRGNTEVERLGQGDANPIWLARLAGIPIVLSFISIYLKKGNTYFYLFVLLTSLSILILASSRGPFISLALCCSLYILLINGKLAKNIYKNVKYLVLFIICIILLPSNFKQRFSNLFSGGLDNNDLSRFQLLTLSKDLFFDQPFGRGIGSFSNYSYFPYPHNLIMEIAVELGVIILLLTILLLTYTIIKSNINLKKNMPMGLQFVIMLMTFSFINAMFSGDLTTPKDLYITLLIMFIYYFNRSALRKIT